LGTDTLLFAGPVPGAKRAVWRDISHFVRPAWSLRCKAVGRRGPGVTQMVRRLFYVSASSIGQQHHRAADQGADAVRAVLGFDFAHHGVDFTGLDVGDENFGGLG
jgi:hypothetical protein